MTKETDVLTRDRGETGCSVFTLGQPFYHSSRSVWRSDTRTLVVLSLNQKVTPVSGSGVTTYFEPGVPSRPSDQEEPVPYPLTFSGDRTGHDSGEREPDVTRRGSGRTH